MPNENAPAEGPRLHNGAYTVQHEKHGHFTVKLYTSQSGDLAGSRIVALLQGPNNETDWKGVGFWRETPAPHVYVWKRYCSPERNVHASPIDGYHWGEGWNRVEKKLAIWTDLALRAYSFTDNGLELLPTWESSDPHEMRGGELFVNGSRRGTSHWRSENYELLLAAKCVICNRALTNPESIRIGIGPECRSKL